MVLKRGGQSFPSLHHLDERRLFSISSSPASSVLQLFATLSPPTHLLIGCSSSLSQLVSCILSSHTHHLVTCCCLEQTSCRGHSLSLVSCLLHPMSTEDTHTCLLAAHLLQLVFTLSSPASSRPCERRPTSCPACLLSLHASIHVCSLNGTRTVLRPPTICRPGADAPCLSPDPPTHAH